MKFRVIKQKASPSTHSPIQVVEQDVYLGATYPQVTGLEQLRRDPHILGWMAYLRAQNPPLATTTCIGRFFALRTIFHELARTRHLAELAYLLLREDIPRSPHTLPRPLTAEQDQLLEQEFIRRNDLGGNVFLLLRYTGMRIGECADQSPLNTSWKCSAALSLTVMLASVSSGSPSASSRSLPRQENSRLPE